MPPGVATRSVRAAARRGSVAQDMHAARLQAPGRPREGRRRPFEEECRYAQKCPILYVRMGHLPPSLRLHVD